jgi:hypothetical protein
MLTEQATAPSLAQRVHDTFLDCLFTDAEVVDGKPTSEPVKAACIMHNFGFHAARLEGHRADVEGFLRQMQPEFFADTGGGWSFLQLCQTRDGRQWAEHPTMEELCGLGIALGLVRWCAPRELWPALPGGMPYLVIELSARAPQGDASVGSAAP